MAKKKSKGKSRARRAGAALIRGAKGTVVCGGTGAVSYHGAMMGAENIEFLRSRWWATPLALLAGGHFVKRKTRLAGVGAALCGVGGYLFEQNRAAAKASAVAAGTAPPGQLPETTGDAGMLVEGGQETGMLVDLDEARNSYGSAMSIGRRGR